MIITSKIGRLKKERTQAHSLLTRGQVATFEQVKIPREALANGTKEHAPPQNRGQVAAQEQFKIMREALGMLNA